MYSGDELFQRSREGYFGVYFPSCEAKRVINAKNKTRVGTETVRHESTYIILFLTRQNESINDYKTTIFTHRSRVLLSFRSADDVTFDFDDVTMTWQLWRYHVNSDI